MLASNGSGNLQAELTFSGEVVNLDSTHIFKFIR